MFEMSKRLMFLEKMTADGSTEAMAWYGLAMEYKSAGRAADALAAFAKLRELHPKYVAMYLMCGTLLAGEGRKEEARAWLETGIATAKASGDTHAVGELETAISTL
jgi:predicted Zn-dependent protease